jgi:hypothetical protein
MVFVPQRAAVIGTSADERAALARTYGCDATWLGDELDKQAVELPAFWIDRSPVTNAEYGAFVAATGARAPWPCGWFATEQADHPVVGVSYEEAAAYAAWAGKRLPSAEEWEVAAQPPQPGPYPWGSAWPGPIREAHHDVMPRWDLPATQPVGLGHGGRSAAGMEDLAGQVCEWTTTARTHHEAPFRVLKGASWLHQDPVNFRTAAASWVAASFYTPLIGFRCALDGAQTPSPVPRTVPPNAPRAVDFPAPSDAAHPRELQVDYLSETSGADHPHLLSWSRRFVQGPAGRSRGFVLYGPALGPWPVCLFLAEALLWNDTQLLAGYRGDQPPLQHRPGAGGRPGYLLEFDAIRVDFAFVIGTDYVDVVTTITNKTAEAGMCRSSSCVSLTSHPGFYDCELLRTYQLTGQGTFAALRTLPRLGDCIRWIAPSDLSRHGGTVHCGVMAVVSRDGRGVFASVRLEEAAPVEVLGNPWLTCLHTDAPVFLGPYATQVTRHRLYTLRGGLDSLRLRLERDVQRGDFVGSVGLS